MQPTGGSESWRTWLVTGARGSTAGRRRVRGAHRGLKRMLVEGMANRSECRRPWNEFSGAMVRHAVDEAMNGLPREQNEIVKLAYFDGLSNREIAEQLGLSVGGVQRRLRQAFARLSDQIERGQAMARRAVYGIAFWFSGRWTGAAARRSSGAAGDHLITAGALIVAGVAAAAVLAVHPSLPTRTHPPSQGVIAARASMPEGPARLRLVQPVVPLPAATRVAAGLVPRSIPLPPSALPSLPSVPPLPPLPLSLPELPSVPSLIGHR